jgi:hypothetical protein
MPNVRRVHAIRRAGGAVSLMPCAPAVTGTGKKT